METNKKSQGTSFVIGTAGNIFLVWILTLAMESVTSMDVFQAFLVKLSHQFTNDEWRDMVNCFAIPPAQKERFQSAYDFFVWLQQNRDLRTSNLQPLKTIFLENGKNHLVVEVEQFEKNYITIYPRPTGPVFDAPKPKKKPGLHDIQRSIEAIVVARHELADKKKTRD